MADMNVKKENGVMYRKYDKFFCTGRSFYLFIMAGWHLSVILSVLLEYWSFFIQVFSDCIFIYLYLGLFKNCTKCSTEWYALLNIKSHEWLRYVVLNKIIYLVFVDIFVKICRRLNFLCFYGKLASFSESYSSVSTSKKNSNLHSLYRK